MDKKFFELCSKVVTTEGLEVYDMDYLYGSHELRLYVVDPETGSAVIDDCIKIDNALTPYIDEEEWMPSELTLEVSSPGVYRGLTCVEHFEAACGELVQLVLKKKLEEKVPNGLPKKIANQKKVIATLVEATNEGIVIELEENKINFIYDEIKKANLEI